MSFSPSTRENGAVTTLTINQYNGSRDDGLFICRTENIAGVDVAFVLVTSSKFISWDTAIRHNILPSATAAEEQIWVTEEFTDVRVLIIC